MDITRHCLVLEGKAYMIQINQYLNELLSADLNYFRIYMYSVFVETPCIKEECLYVCNVITSEQLIRQKKRLTSLICYDSGMVLKLTRTSQRPMCSSDYEKTLIRWTSTLYLHLKQTNISIDTNMHTSIHIFYV